MGSLCSNSNISVNASMRELVRSSLSANHVWSHTRYVEDQESSFVVS